MGWKTIQGRRYLYRKIRSGGKVKTVYVGRGPAAELVALEMERRKEEGAAKRSAVQEQKVAADRLRQLAEQAADQFQLLVRATLVAAGWYQHNRCEWRPRRFANGGAEAEGVTGSGPSHRTGWQGKRRRRSCPGLAAAFSRRESGGLAEGRGPLPARAGKPHSSDFRRQPAGHRIASEKSRVVPQKLGRPQPFQPRKGRDRKCSGGVVRTA